MQTRYLASALLQLLPRLMSLKLIVACLATASAAKKGPKVTNKVRRCRLCACARCVLTPLAPRSQVFFDISIGGEAAGRVTMGCACRLHLRPCTRTLTIAACWQAVRRHGAQDGRELPCALHG